MTNRMDELFFKRRLTSCQTMLESMHFVEILNYSDSKLNTRKFDALADNAYNKFLSRSGVFAPRHEALLSNGLRLLLHIDARGPDAFSPKTISLSNNAYEFLVDDMRLPRWAIETSSIVGPFFYFDVVGEVGDRYFQFVLRKSDSQHRGAAQDWEMTLSYSFKTHITSGYVKAAASTDLKRLVKELLPCAERTAHPFLLPLLVLDRELCTNMEEVQRRVRDNLQVMENSLSGWSRKPSGRRECRSAEEADINMISRILADARDHIVWVRPETWKQVEEADINNISRMLADARGHMVWVRPETWKQVLESVKTSLGLFWDELPLEDKASMVKLHQSIEWRRGFIMARLAGIESYTQDTKERLEIQAKALDAHLLETEARMSSSRTRDASIIASLTLVSLPVTFVSAFISASFRPEPGVATRPLGSSTMIAILIIQLAATALTFFARISYLKFRKGKLGGRVRRVERTNALDAGIMKVVNFTTGPRRRPRAIDAVNIHVC